MKRATRIAGAVATGVGVASLAYFGGLRARHMRWGATDAELKATLPGDELLPLPAGQVTHAVTIRATPGQIWPWIMQIGQDRSGFYSYTWAENLIGCQMPKVERIVPDWKTRKLGETVWFATPKHFGGSGRMIAAVVQLRRSLAMVSVADWERLQLGENAKEVVWSFTLEKVGDRETRLIARLRLGPSKSMGQQAAGLLIWEPAHFFMERKMLLTVKSLAERTPTIVRTVGASHVSACGPEYVDGDLSARESSAG